AGRGLPPRRRPGRASRPGAAAAAGAARPASPGRRGRTPAQQRALLLVVLGLVVQPQDVLAEVAGRIVPDRVDVVRAVLDVVVLDDERRPLHPVIVGLAA